MKKILCCILAAIMVLSMVACGESASKPSSDGAYYFGSDGGKDQLIKYPNSMNPLNVYDSIEYTPALFYGIYQIDDMEKNQAEFAKTATFEEITYSETYSIYSAEENVQTQKLSTLPYKIDMGAPGSNFGRKLRGNHEWAVLYLVNESGNKQEVLCTYTVSGNTISFAPLAGYEEVHNEDFSTNKILYTVGTATLDYTFKFRGTTLTLTRDNQSVELKTQYFANYFSTISIGGYAALNSAIFDGIDNFSAGSYQDGGSYIYITGVNDELYSASLNNACIRMYEDGRITLYWETTDENDKVIPHVHHFIYFPGGGYNMALSDGETIYYYTETSITREALALGAGMGEEDQALLNALDDSDIEKLAKKKASLLEDLAKAYEEAGLNVAINKLTGEITLDSSILFAYNDSTLSEEGKTFLQQFIKVYSGVVFGEEYEDFVSRIMVEGHTDPTGSYEVNKPLSEARANSVLTYCLSEECGVDAATLASLTETLQSIGYADEKPIYGPDGKVDNDASRRVSFRFIINLQQD